MSVHIFVENTYKSINVSTIIKFLIFDKKKIIDISYFLSFLEDISLLIIILLKKAVYVTFKPSEINDGVTVRFPSMLSSGYCLVDL